MIERTVTIRNRAGMHTRPAALLVKLASNFQAEFFLSKDGIKINGKSIIGVMTLAAEFGSTLRVQFDGPDEEVAAEAIVALFETGFGEIGSVPKPAGT
jgi:phosphocarrier protein HPr